MQVLLIVTIAAIIALINAISYELMASNPTQFLQRASGRSALYCLLLTLTITPLRKLSGWVWIVRFRRTLGLMSFFFAVVHLASFLVLDHGLDFTEISVDVVKRPFILLGILTFALLAPLAATSTANTKKRLGSRRWKLLHQLIYPASVLANIHYFSLKKVDLTGPIICAIILTVLLAWRVYLYWQQRRVYVALLKER
jgi:methionine sulfoxide reductase heme-binding subunit